MSEAKERVTCIVCNRGTEFPAGYLTEDQKANFKCPGCLGEAVVDRQMQERQTTEGGKKLLLEG